MFSVFHTKAWEWKSLRLEQRGLSQWVDSARVLPKTAFKLQGHVSLNRI